MKKNQFQNVAVIMALPMESQGLFEAENIQVHYSGIGKINAAMKTTEVILKYQPDLVLNLGTAGSQKFNTHTLLQCTQIVQRDMDITPLGFPLGETPMDEVPAVIEIENYFPELPTATCATGDSFETGVPKLPCDLVDMEAYAIAKVCRKFQIPVISLKYITDGHDDEAHKDWRENLIPGAKALLAIYQHYFSK